jgi:hypothetical protein
MFNIVNAHTSAQEKIRGALLNPVRQLLTDGRIHEWCRRCGHVWRQRRFCPVVSLLACILKQLIPTSARDVEDHVALLAATMEDGVRDGRDFCNARARLPLPVFQQGQRFTGAAASSIAALLYKNLKVALFDGTTARTARTDANRKAFGAATNQHGESRSPVMRLGLLVCAGCGAVLDLAFGPYTVAEARLFVLVMMRLPAAMLVVADTTACSFMTFVLARERGSHMLCPLRPDRKRQITKRLGHGETVELWSKPASSQVAYPHLLKAMPAVIEVRVIECIVSRRGYRDYKLTLATTLLDPVQHPASALLELYLQRWNIELDFRTLKHQHGLECLTGKKPQIVCREMFSAVLAYNCVRATMAQASASPRRLSHRRAVVMLSNMSCRMAAAAAIYLPELFKLLLSAIRTAQAPRQERPPEPRAVLQRHRSFPYLTIPRRLWREQYYAVS